MAKTYEVEIGQLIPDDKNFNKGTELVAVKRTDIGIDTKEGRELALADNATAHVNLEWDVDELTEAADDYGINLDDWGVETDDIRTKGTRSYICCDLRYGQ